MLSQLQRKRRCAIAPLLSHPRISLACEKYAVFIPHELLGVPLFGWGWVLGLFVVVTIASALYQWRSGRAWNEIASGLWGWLLAVPIIVWLLPGIEQKWPDGTPIGLPVRGYGVMVLLGLVVAVAITIRRARQLGIHPDNIVGLAIWTMVGGVVGARTFYVVQKWESFSGQGLDLVVEIFKLTEGGLVIYGGMIGGLIAGLWYCYRHRLHAWSVADLITPGFLIGLSLGRLGCLLHGCCFGGVCEAHWLCIQFPQGSLPYQAQVDSGRLLGLQLDGLQLPAIIRDVQTDSPASRAGIHAGDQLNGILTRMIEPSRDSDPAAAPAMMVEVRLDRGTRSFLPENLPPRSLPVHPAQIYASINALLLCLLTWTLQPLVRRDGLVFLSGVTLYAVSRFLEEQIRSDELGQLGTRLTISQWIALASGLIAALGIVWLWRLPAGRAWRW